jgi:hypothetical protein
MNQVPYVIDNTIKYPYSVTCILDVSEVSEHIKSEGDLYGSFDWTNDENLIRQKNEGREYCEIVHQRTHADGWTIRGVIHADYYIWVEDFEAEHPIHGKVSGHFGKVVRADSKTGYDDFFANHTPHEFDYGDI